MNNALLKVLGRRTLQTEVSAQLRDANSRLIKARCAIAEAEGELKKLEDKKFVYETAIADIKQAGKYKDEIFDIQLKILEAENGLDYARSEVNYQSNRVARLSNYFRDVAK